MKHQNITKNNSGTVKNENNKEIPKERYISKLKTKTYWYYNNNYNSIIMACEKIIDLLQNTSNQPTKFRTKK